MKRSGLYPRPKVDVARVPAVGQAGGALLIETARVTGLDKALSGELARWMKPTAVHDPAKVVLDLALAVALGGDCLADLGVLRSEPGVFGKVASEATVSRTITTLARDADKVLAAITKAHKAARTTAWRLAGDRAPGADANARKPLVIDIAGTLVTSHSDKEGAAPTFKRGYGFHPLLAYVDHGEDGTGEYIAGLFRKGNAGSNTAIDHIAVTKAAIKALPGRRRGSKKILIRTDGAGFSKKFLKHLHRQGLGYSVGFVLPIFTPELVAMLNDSDVWTPAINAEGEIRKGAFVAELTGLLDLSTYPDGMRVIVRKERPHPGAQLRFDDVDGMRITAFATNTPPGGPGSQLPQLELRHRRRARVEDRIRCAKDTGLNAFPLQGFDQNRIWLAIVALAGDLIAWAQMLTLTSSDARRWEPKKLRLRIFTLPATLVRRSRAQVLHLADKAKWAPMLRDAITTLRALAPPG
jgi:hypothetical protein